jgi:hypothetical protein
MISEAFQNGGSYGQQMKRIELVHRRGYLQAEGKLAFAVFDVPVVPHVQSLWRLRRLYFLNQCQDSVEVWYLTYRLDIQQMIQYPAKARSLSLLHILDWL